MLGMWPMLLMYLLRFLLYRWPPDDKLLFRWNWLWHIQVSHFNELCVANLTFCAFLHFCLPSCFCRCLPAWTQWRFGFQLNASNFSLWNLFFNLTIVCLMANACSTNNAYMKTETCATVVRLCATFATLIACVRLCISLSSDLFANVWIDLWPM